MSAFDRFSSQAVPLTRAVEIFQLRAHALEFLHQEESRTRSIYFQTSQLSYLFHSCNISLNHSPCSVSLLPIFSQSLYFLVLIFLLLQVTKI